MGLDRGALARIDRKLLAGLGKDEVFQMVRVPVAAAKWSTWKRYCDSAGISMGRAIATLIDHELSTVFGDTKIESSSVLAVQAGEELARRQAEVARRERELEAAEERLWAWGQQLRRREEDLVTREQRADPSAVPSVRPERPRNKVGRNEPCPCGLGRKYKHCHGSPGTMRRPPRDGDLTG